jgi:hypothetical protein
MVSGRQRSTCPRRAGLQRFVPNRGFRGRVLLECRTRVRACEWRLRSHHGVLRGAGGDRELRPRGDPANHRPRRSGGSDLRSGGGLVRRPSTHFFSVAHHPTQIDQQLPDVGREYRSHIYYNNESQRQVAEAYIDQLNASGALEKPIATRVDARQAVYRAEDQHQDFAAKNTNSSYVLIYSFPKVAKLAGVLPALFRPNQSG